MENQKDHALIFGQIVLMFLLGACGSTQTPPPEQLMLPTASLKVTHAPTIAQANPVFFPTPTPTLIPQPAIFQMADELFGSRQIQSISIPSLNIVGTVIPVGWRVDFSGDLSGGNFEWDSPGGDVGWVITSALPDQPGNIILYGHNNIYGKIFKDLYDIKEGDVIKLATQTTVWEYRTRYILLLPVSGVDDNQVKQYQKYLQPTADARVTIISCWPPFSNTHRVVVIAQKSEGQ